MKYLFSTLLFTLFIVSISACGSTVTSTGGYHYVGTTTPQSIVTPQVIRDAVQTCRLYTQRYAGISKGAFTFPVMGTRKTLASKVGDGYQVDDFFTVDGADHTYVCRTNGKGKIYYYIYE